jgi:hypothetical protein
MKRTRALLAIGCACIVPFSLIACGDDKDDSAAATTATTTTSAPEDVIAPDTKVAAGLTGLKKLATSISQTTSTAAAKLKAKGLEAFWAPVEGTVKRNEPDMYATIEEDLSLLESGEPAKTKTGASELNDTVDAYLAAHPA